MANIDNASQAQPSALAEQPQREDVDFDAFLNQQFGPAGGGGGQQQVAPNPASIGQEQVDPQQAEAMVDALIERTLVPEVAEGSALSVLERGKLSFAVTDKEKKAFLEKLPNVEEVIEDDGEFTLVRNGKRQKVDPDTFELLADVADFGREIFEIGVEAPAAIAGAGAGPVGFIAAAAGGAAVATNVADFVASELIGIDRDESRSRVTETALAAGLSGLFAGAGKLASKLITKRKLAKEAAEKFSNLDALSQSSKEFIENVEMLGELGLKSSVEGVDGKPINFLITSLESSNPQVKQIADKIRTNPEFQRIESEIGEQAFEHVNQIVKTIGDNQGINNVIDRASKDGNISSKITGMIKKLKLDEGKTIEKFKRFASEEFRSSPAPVEFTDKKLQDVFKELGIGRKGDNLIGLDAESIADKLIVENSPAIKRFARDLGELTEELFNNGGLSPDGVEKFVKRIGDLNASPLMRKSGKLRFIAGELSSALRKDRIGIVETALEGTPQSGQFKEAMKKFSTIQKSITQVNELLDGNEMASGSFVISIFNKGKDGLADLRAAKGLIKSENPELWRELSGEFVNQVVDDVTDAGTKQLSMASFSKKMLSFGKEFRKEIMEDSPFDEKDLRRAMNVARKMEGTKFAKLSRSQQEDIMRNIAGIGSPFMQAKMNAAISFVKRLMPNNAERQFLAQEGIDRFLGKVPKADRARTKKVFEQALVLMGDLKPAATATVRTGASVGTREGINEVE